jgi:Tfp pilus assembly protein PilN
MIKINLLGDVLAQAGGNKKAAAAEPVQVYGQGEGSGGSSLPIAGALVTLLGLAGAGIYYYTLTTNIKNETERKVALEAEKKTYEPYIKLEADYRRKKEELQKKEEVMVNLRKQQQLPVHFLEELANSIPDDVWFTKISQKGMSFTVEGESRSFEAAQAFYANIQSRSRWFKNVKYPGATKAPGFQNLKFTMTFDLQNAV